MAGRPRSFDRDSALAVAVEQFWRAGYEQTTISMLTKAMGVTPPSLYAAFGDKEALFEEAATAYFGRMCEVVDQATGLPTAMEAIAKMLHETARAHTNIGSPPGCLMLSEPRLVLQRQLLHERIRARLEQGLVDGDLADSTHPDQVASFLMAVMRGMSACAKDGGTTDEVLGIAATAMSALAPLNISASTVRHDSPDDWGAH